MTAEHGLAVAVLFGGRSAEHSISTRSAQSVVEAIDHNRFRPVLVGIDRVGRWFHFNERAFRVLEGEVTGAAADEVVPLRRAGRLEFAAIANPETPGTSADVVFPVLHGPYGEDGTVQGMLEVLDVPYVGCGVLGSAVGMDKDVGKRLLAAAGVPVVPWEVVTRLEWERDAERVGGSVEALGRPLFVKPANLGSSVGITRVGEGDDLPAAMRRALEYDTKLVVESGVDAREIECAVLGNEEPEASVPGEIVPGENFYSYDDKYASDSQARLLIPAPLSEDLATRIREAAVRAFLLTGCAGMARVDFFLERGTERVYVNELNTIPGFTSISMYPRLWEATGLPYPSLITRLIELAMQRHAVRAALSLV